MFRTGIMTVCLLAPFVQPLAAVQHFTSTLKSKIAVNALSTRAVSNLSAGNAVVESLCILERDVRIELDSGWASSATCAQQRTSGAAADSVIDFVSLLRTSRRQRRHKAQLLLHSHRAGVRHFGSDSHLKPEFGRRVAWISGYARSATSTVLSMINAAAVGETNGTLSSPTLGTLQATTHVLQNPSSMSPAEMVDKMLDHAEKTSLYSTTVSKIGNDTLPGLLVEAPPSKVFALFEPCHEGDRVADPLLQRGCGGLLSSLAHCDFSQVVSLHGFRNPHTSHHNELAANPGAASAFCSAADLVTIKTIEYAHDLRQALLVLDADPSIYMIDVVRDPRGIYASWKQLEPFATFLKGPNATLMPDICRSFAANINVTHPRLRRIVFEELVKAPGTVMSETYNFLGLPFGQAQLAWIASTFDATDCQQKIEENHLNAMFSDCQANSTVSMSKWRQQLLPDELQLFASDTNCQEVALAYNFEM